MFKSFITTTPFVSDVAESFFLNIGGEAFQRDVSFLSTLRALVNPRMGDGDALYLRFGASSYSAENLRNTAAHAAVEVVSAIDPYERDTIIVHNFTNCIHENNTAWMELMKANFCKVYNGWHPLEKVTQFFKKQFYVLCFVNPDTRCVVLFTDNMDIRKMHYLQCGIFAYLPWYFDPAQGVSELEMELINSLREKTSEKYMDCLSKLAEKYDFRTAKIKRLLSGFETRFEEIERDEAQECLRNKMSYIENLNRQIGDALAEQRRIEIRLLGLETKIAQGGDDSEIMDYFMRNNSLVLESVNNTTMVFGVKCYLSYFDEDMAKSMIDNPTSYVYRPRGRGCNNIIPAEDMKMLMNAIFIDQTLRVKMCAAYEFKLDGNVRARNGFAYGSEYREYTPNTHIDRFACIGNYQRPINSFLAKHDYISAIEQCVASCRSLNFGDYPVMQEFMSRLYEISDYNVNIRCIELPDGKVVKPKEAIEYLKEANANG